MIRGGRRGRPDSVYVITSVPASTLPARRRRYLTLMLLRVLSVPGVLLLPVPVVVQAIVVVVAAVAQMGAVISANEPMGTVRGNTDGTDAGNRSLPDGGKAAEL